MKNDSAPVHPDFRTAFCAAHRCKPTAFRRKVFRKALPFHAKLLCLFLGGASHPRFQHDLEAIENIGEAASVDDFNRVLDEMWSLHELDRDWARRFLGLRISTRRLQEVFAPLAERVQSVEVTVEVDAASPMSMSADLMEGPARDGGKRYRPAEVAAQRLRRALRIHSAVTAGRELEDVLVEERLSRRELDEILAEFGRMRSELAWLQGYLRERDELEQLRASLRRAPAMTMA